MWIKNLLLGKLNSKKSKKRKSILYIRAKLIEHNSFFMNWFIESSDACHCLLRSFLYRSCSDDRNAIGAKWVGQSRCSFWRIDDAHLYSVSDPQSLASTLNDQQHQTFICLLSGLKISYSKCTQGSWLSSTTIFDIRVTLFH